MRLCRLQLCSCYLHNGVWDQGLGGHVVCIRLLFSCVQQPHAEMHCRAVQVAYISNLAVVPRARRCGVGRLLVRRAEEVRGCASFLCGLARLLA